MFKNRRCAEPSADSTDQARVSESPCSPHDLDAIVSSWTGAKEGLGGEVHRSASGPVVAEPVLTGAILAEIVSTEPQQFQKGTRQYGSSTAVSEDGAASDSYQCNLADPVATNTLAPAPACPATAAAAGVGWPDATRAQEQKPRVRGVGVADPAGAPAPELQSAPMERGSGATQDDMGLTDADLLDISAMLMSEDGPLDELPLDELPLDELPHMQGSSC